MPISELCAGRREVSTGSQRRSLRTNKSWWWAIPCRGATFIKEGLMLAAVLVKSTLAMCSRRQVDFVFWIALTESCKGDYSFFFVISWYSSCKASITTIRTMIKFSERRRRQSGKVSAIAFVFLVVTLWYFAEVPHCWRFTPNAAYLNENHASNENNLGKHASFALATGKWRNNKHEMFH